MIDPVSFLASHKSIIFLPPSGNPLMYLLVGGRAAKVVTFLNNIYQTKTSVGGLNKAFFTI
jgi:hypothetical protein